MDKMSEEDLQSSIKTVDVNQKDYTSKFPYKNSYEDQNLTDKELKMKPSILTSKDICSHSNHDHLGITKLGTIYVCLICKTNVHFSELDPCNKNHLSSNEHKVHQSELFKQCFYDPGLNSTKIYSYISSNSYIDFSSASQICTNEVNDICFVCNHEIPTPKGSQSVLVDDVLNHLKDDNHIRNIQDNFSWTCNMLSSGHLTLYKTLFYCSVCEVTISCDDYRLIQTVVNHLESKHSEDCVSGGLEEDRICLKNKTSQDLHLTASGESSDCDQLEDVSDDLYSTCSEEYFGFEDNVSITSTSEVILPQIQEYKTINNDHEDYFYVCTECGENIEIIDDDFEISLQLHSTSHERERDATFVLPTRKSYIEQTKLKAHDNLCSTSHERERDATFVLPTRKSYMEQKKLNALDNLCSATTSSSKGFVVEEQHQVSIKESAICNAGKNVPNGHKKQDRKQTNTEQNLPTKKRNDTDNKFFLDLSDCLPASFHKDLSLVAIKSNQLYCELCICSVGVVLNVFDSSFILHSHFSSLYHKNQMDLVDDIKNENNKPKTKQSLPNKIKKVKIYTNSNFKKTDVNKLTSNKQKQNELRHSSSSGLTVRKPYDLYSVSNNNTSQVVKQTNMSSNITSKDKNTSDLEDISNPIVQKQAQAKVVPDSSSRITPIHSNTYEVGPTEPTTPVSSFIIDLLNDSNLRVHQEFLKHSGNNIYCCLCSSEIDRNQADLIDHIIGIKHKVQFLSQLKKSLRESQRNQVKFLLFINKQLYCSICKCYITPWNSFVGICQGVEAHFAREAHSVSDGEKQKSGETIQEVTLKKTAVIEAKISLDAFHHKKSDIKENKQEIRNDLSGNSSNKSCEAVVKNRPKSTKLVANIDNDSASGLNQIMIPSKLDMKLQPVKELSEVLQTNNTKSRSPDVSKGNYYYSLN